MRFWDIAAIAADDATFAHDVIEFQRVQGYRSAVERTACSSPPSRRSKFAG